ncbi:MAG: site-specific integrase [Chloroflexi bacterium]|nr:site-specific integrase [Chloroflexota bacterium]
MRGSIIKRYKGSYTIVLNLGIDPQTGKRRQQWISIKGTKKDAEKKLAELLHQLDTGTFIKPGKATLREFLERWLTDYAKPNLSPRGYERYESIVRVHLIPNLGRILLTQLRPEHLQKHYSTKLNGGLSARTVRYHHVVLHKALQTAVKWGMVGHNVADGVDVPRARHTEMQTWDEDDVRRFLEAAKNSPYYALFYISLFSGARRSEVLGLRWQDVDFMLGQIYINRSLHHLKNGSYVFTQPKSAKSRRTIALPPSAILVLKEHRGKQELEQAMLGVLLTGDDLVFSTPEGKPLRPNTVSRAWTMLASRAGVRSIRLHDARHTHASLLMKQGVHPKVVMERLGHSTIATTLDIYSHVAPGLQEAAAKRFDEAISGKYNEPADKMVR